MPDKSSICADTNGINKFINIDPAINNIRNETTTAINLGIFILNIWV